jgi:hypothetical protein
MKRIIGYILSFLALASCETPYRLDNEQASPQITIEGLVTDIPGRQYVKVTMSNGFYSSGHTPRITDALVSVTDNLGNETNYVHNPGNHPDSAGIYLPLVPFHGEIGRTYNLKVIADGKVYEANDKINKILPVDSITYNVDDFQSKQKDNKGKIYAVKLFAHEDPTTKDFYLFKFFRNDTLAYTNDTDIYYTDDVFLSEHIEGIAAPVFFRKGEKVKVESYSISRNGYVFYNDLSTLLNNDSGMFSPIPSSPRTNLSNGALGFFQASQLDIREVEIK